MRTPAQMTIQDYFDRVGLTSGRGRGAGLGAVRGNDRAAVEFANVLDGIQSTAPVGASSADSGMRIGDYRKQPVPAQAALRRSPLPAGGDAPAAARPAGQAAGGFLPSGPPPAVPLPGPEAVSGHGGQTGPRVASLEARIAESIRSAAARYHLPARLIHSVIRAESNFQPDAVSRAGAQGLMQLMPATARELGVTDPFDIDQNIDGGARYLRQMLDRFDGNVRRALAAYNAGPGAVARYNGEVPYVETRNYVAKVLAFSRQYDV